MMCHGAGGGTDYWKENSAYQSLVNTFVSGGYAVFDCSGFKNESPGLNFWGDPRGVDCWRKAYQYVVDNYNVEKQFSIYGFSMGGLTTMNLVFSRFPNIKCVAIASPVLSLEASYNDSGVNQVIKNLYGMGNTYDKTKAYGSDPYAHIFTYNNTPYVFDALPPLKIWYGSTETGGGVDATGKPNLVGGAVSKYIAEYFTEAINNAGGLAEYREVQGAGHEICYGGNAVCRSDYLLYFDRHNY
jgi:dipeptidyl aminopeptidase/acylaminoacyl peptidase